MVMPWNWKLLLIITNRQKSNVEISYCTFHNTTMLQRHISRVVLHLLNCLGPRVLHSVRSLERRLHHSSQCYGMCFNCSDLLPTVCGGLSLVVEIHFQFRVGFFFFYPEHPSLVWVFLMSPSRPYSGREAQPLSRGRSTDSRDPVWYLFWGRWRGEGCRECVFGRVGMKVRDEMRVRFCWSMKGRKVIYLIWVGRVWWSRVVSDLWMGGGCLLRILLWVDDM